MDKVLSSLDSVKKTAPDRWIAKCPAHNDRRPSLSIREAEDGKVLLKCWSGCGAAEIVNALGLSLADLFPGDRRSLNQHGIESMRRPFSWQDALKGVAHEITVACLIVAAVNRGDELDADSLDRLSQAEERISDALQTAGGVQ
ncbi:hypothetical protein HF671_14015 [Acidithiobacillus thiooxidans]|nr:hypothetical protein [Acidithiobacillus thiooxidans]